MNCRVCAQPLAGRRYVCPEICASRYRERLRAKRIGRTCAVCDGPTEGIVCGKKCRGRRDYQLRLQRNGAAIAREAVGLRDAESRRIEAALALLDKRRKGQRWAA